MTRKLPVLALIPLTGCLLLFPVVETSSESADAGFGTDAVTDRATIDQSAKVTCSLENLLADVGTFETGIVAWRSAAEVSATLEKTDAALEGIASLKVCAPATTSSRFYAVDLNSAFRLPSQKSGRYLLKADVAPTLTSAAPRVQLGIDSLVGSTRMTGPRSELRSPPTMRTCIASVLLVNVPETDPTVVDPGVFFQNADSSSCIIIDNVSLYYLGDATSVPAGCDCP